MVKVFKKKIAVFDIDGTIFRSSLLIEFNKALQRTGVIRATDATALLKPYYAWMERRGSYDDYLKKVVEVHVKAIKGKEQRFVLFFIIASEFIVIRGSSSGSLVNLIFC